MIDQKTVSYFGNSFSCTNLIMNYGNKVISHSKAIINEFLGHSDEEKIWTLANSTFESASGFLGDFFANACLHKIRLGSTSGHTFFAALKAAKKV